MAVRDFPPRPQGAPPDSVPYQNWLDALGQRQNIDLLQELTSVASGDEIAIFDASETGNNKTKKATVANILALVSAMQYSDARFKSGSFTNDLSAATGTQAVTGVGFQPKAIILLASILGGHSWGSIGFTTSASSNRSFEFDFSGLAVLIQPNFASIVRTASGNYKTGALSTFDSDGFTLSFTKVGTPTGTQTINYLAFR